MWKQHRAADRENMGTHKQTVKQVYQNAKNAFDETALKYTTRIAITHKKALYTHNIKRHTTIANSLNNKETLKSKQ